MIFIIFIVFTLDKPVKKW